MIESLQGGYQTQAITYTAQGSRAREQAQPVSSGDTVSLSESGRLMSDFFAGIGVDHSSGGAISLEDLTDGLARKRQALEDGINTMFLENDIATDPPVNLTTDGAGRVRVQGEHPQKAEIEELFKDNPELSDAFRNVSGLSSLVAACKEYTEFAAMYAQDPYAAVAQYGHLFDNLANNEFSLTIDGTKADSGREADSDMEADTARVARPDFSNATRQELMDWVNSAITGGHMSLDEGSAYMAMTMKIDTETGQPVDPATDTERLDFLTIARDGIAGAEYLGDEALADRLRHALEIMTG